MKKTIVALSVLFAVSSANAMTSQDYETVKGVADNALAAANRHTDGQAKASKSYTDQQVQAANRHTDAQAEASRGYTDQQMQAANRHTDAQITSANNYAKGLASTAAAQSLSAANNYTDRVAHGLQSQIDDNKRAIKRLGASAEATANLHYNGNRNGYALAVGQYSDETALAAGMQFGINEHNAVTVQASYDAEDVGGSIGFHGDF